MGDAILGRALRCGQLVEGLALQLVVFDGGDQVGTPVGGRVRRATRADATAPLVGEDDLVAGVAEGRRVPVGHVRIEHLGDACRIVGIGDVQQEAVAAAGPGRAVDGRIDGDVMSLVGLGRPLAGHA